MLSGRLKMEKIFRIKSLVSAAVVVSGFMLTGCSSDGGSSVTSPNGIYTGNIIGGDASSNGVEEKAVIYNNRMMILSNKVDGVSQFFNGNITENGTSFTGTGERYSPAGLLANIISYSASFVAGQTVTVDFTEVTTGSATLLPGSVDLTSNVALYTKGSDLTRLAGTWSGIFVAGSNASMVLNIDSTGGISAGSGDQGDGADCIFSGAFNVVDASVNIYSLSLMSLGGSGNGGTVCHVSPGTYSGLAWTEGDTNGTLVLMAADGSRGRAVVLTKN